MMDPWPAEFLSNCSLRSFLQEGRALETAWELALGRAMQTGIGATQKSRLEEASKDLDPSWREEGHLSPSSLNKMGEADGFVLAASTSALRTRG